MINPGQRTAAGRRFQCGAIYSLPTGKSCTSFEALHDRARALGAKRRAPLRAEGLDQVTAVGYWFAGPSGVTIPVGPAFSAFAFLVARFLSTQSSAVFRSVLRAS